MDYLLYHQNLYQKKVILSIILVSINFPIPHSMVSGLSVVSLHTNTFFIAQTASSCNPPLSVIIPLEFNTKLKYYFDSFMNCNIHSCK